MQKKKCWCDKEISFIRWLVTANHGLGECRECRQKRVKWDKMKCPNCSETMIQVPTWGRHKYHCISCDKTYKIHEVEG
jgi:transposase-like protein